MAIRLIGPNDCDAVRSLLLPSKTAAAALALLPDSIITLDSIGGRAEALVLERLGRDGPLFMTSQSTIPAYYAQGDPELARQLVQDALVQFCCGQLLLGGFLQQLIPVLKRTGSQETSFALKWEDRQKAFMAAGYAALFLLRRPVPVAGRRFTSPSAGASGRMEAHLHTDMHHHRHGWREGDW